MAEQFLEEIYQKALIIQQLREYIKFTYDGCPRDARRLYNQAACGIEGILAELEQADPALANELVQAAVDVRDHYENDSYAVSIVEGRLLPALFQYMQYYADIDVTEGKYRLYSAKTGFLTVCDTETGRLFHNEYDPLWEAERIAASIYEPKKECYHILGVGLGYLPYQLWRQSEGAVKLVIYEEDETILSYARIYGVLDWIAEDALEIVYEKDPERLEAIFAKAVENEDSAFYISPWKMEQYKETQNGKIRVLGTNALLERSTRFRTAVNLRKNQKHLQISLEEIKSQLCYKEWIVVSAGPSLDEQITFLKESKGQKGIVAVNTVLRRLFREGVRPDLVVAADQYVQMKEHIDGIGEQTAGIPMIAEERVNWQYTEQYQGAICFVKVGDAADEESWKVSGSVAGLALEAAVRLGAEKVYLVGQDLAYPDGKTYAAGMPYVAEAQSRGTMLVPSADGGMVPTSEAFNWFRIGLETQIASYPDVRFVNLSRHGALIKGCVKE